MTLKNKSREVLIDAFMKKWELAAYSFVMTDKAKITETEMRTWLRDRNDEFTPITPCIMMVQLANDRLEYYIAFKNSLVKTPDVLRLTKDRMIDPEKHLGKNQLKQLVEWVASLKNEQV